MRRSTTRLCRTSIASTAALALLLTLTISGCSLFDNDEERFTIQVETISAPDSIGVNDVLTARFQGQIGPDLCSRFENVEKQSVNGGVELRFIGVRKNDDDCAQTPAALDHVESFQPPLSNPFIIRVQQPQGGSLEKTVKVE